MYRLFNCIKFIVLILIKQHVSDYTFLITLYTLVNFLYVDLFSNIQSKQSGTYLENPTITNFYFNYFFGTETQVRIKPPRLFALYCFKFFKSLSPQKLLVKTNYFHLRFPSFRVQQNK